MAIDSELDLDQLAQSEAEYGQMSSLERTSTGLESPPIFIVGSPRSGTTVLGKCLAANSRCNMGEESFFMTHFWHIFSDLHSGMNWRNWAPIANMVDEQTLLELIGDFSDKIFSTLVAQKPGADTYVDQTQWYGSIAPFIDKVYPDARYLHILRDGREVTRSLRVLSDNGSRWAGTNFEDSVTIWRTQVENCLKIREATPERYTEVDYQDLVMDSESAIREICERLGLEYEFQMLTPLRTPISDPTREDYKVLSPSREKTTQWPKEWSSTDQSVFQEIAGGLMKQLKYDRR